MQQGISADGKIQVLRFRFHGTGYLGGNDAEQVAVLIIDRAAAVAGTDGGRDLQNVIAGSTGDNPVADGKIQPLRMTDDKDFFSHLHAVVRGHRLREFTAVTKT